MTEASTQPVPVLAETAVRVGAGRIRRARSNAFRFLRNQPLGAAGLLIVFLVVVIAVAAPAIATHGVNETSLGDRLVGPSSEHYLGTDNLGRDQFSRIIYGTRTTLQVSLGAVVIGITIALSVGMISGYFGGWFDIVAQRIVDAWMAFPTLILLLALVAVLGAGVIQIIGVLSLLIGVGGIRVLRATALGYRNSTFIEAAQVIGASPARILVRHLMPNLFGPLMILTTLGLSSAILAEASLSFLGFGVPPPAASWGRMLSGSSSLYLYKAPWLAIFPGLAITIVVFGVNMLGDALRDELDPRMRGGR
jgi:peptide/nickel transport system permease protein